MTRFLSLKKEYISYVVVLLFGLVLSAVAANAATTISTNINTAGTLTVTGASTLTGAVYASSTLQAATMIAYTSLGVASSSPYVALGVTGTTTSSAGVVIGSGGSGITQLLFGTCSVNLPAISATTTGVANCTATGVTTGDRVFVTPNSLPIFVMFTGASSTAADTIQVAAFNTASTSSSIVDPAAATWSWMAVH